MASLFVLPFTPALTLPGLVAGAATLTFYISETSTLTTIRDTDGDALPNPITADAFGRFVPIYLDSDVTYRVVLKNALGAVLDEIDPYSIQSAATLSFIQNGSGAVSRSIQDKMREIVSVEDFGGAVDGSTNDATAWQTLIDSFGTTGGASFLNRGITYTTGTMLMKSEQRHDFGKATLNLTPSGLRAIDIGWGQPTQIYDVELIGGRLELHGVGKTAIGIQNAYAPVLETVNIRLLDDQQTGIHIRGNVTPPGPYYGTLNNVRIFGNANDGGEQAGIVLEQIDASGRYAINRWNFTSIRHIAAVDIGMDIRGADGQVFGIVNLENCYNTAIRFNFAAPSRSSNTSSSSVDGSFFYDTTFAAAGLSTIGAVVVTSGQNAGQSSPVRSFDPDTGQFILESQLPYPFASGDSYTFTTCQANQVELPLTTLETAAIAVDWLAGSSGCVVRFGMRTQDPSAIVFRRAVEDISNRMAREYETFYFEAAVPVGTNLVHTQPSFTNLSRGGMAPIERGWIEAVRVTAGSRTTNDGSVAGTIRAKVYAGAVYAGDDLAPVLTPTCPWRQRRIRKLLMAADLITPQQSINVDLDCVSLAQADYVRVAVTIGYP